MKEGVSEKKSKLTVFLVVMVIILAIIVIYAFILQPTFNGYVTKFQDQGINLTLNAIFSQLQQTGGAVQIPISSNQTLTLYDSSVIPKLCSQMYPANTSNTAASTVTTNSSH